MSLDYKKLTLATLSIYKESFSEAVRGFISSWKYLLYHVALLLILTAAMFTMSFIGGGYAGGFIMGFLLAYLVACYLTTVQAGLRLEKLTFQDMFKEGGQLFSPVISFLFTFFVLSFVTRSVSSGQNAWMIHVLNLFLCVFFNPAPEIIIQHPGFLMSMLRQAYEFILENFVEWFLPTFILLIPVFLYSPTFSLELGLLLMTNNPLSVIQSVMIGASGFGAILGGGILIIPFLIMIYFTFLFRLSLFKKLDGSTRRKRIYQYGS